MPRSGFYGESAGATQPLPYALQTEGVSEISRATRVLRCLPFAVCMVASHRGLCETLVYRRHQYLT